MRKTKRRIKKSIIILFFFIVFLVVGSVLYRDIPKFFHFGRNDPRIISPDTTKSTIKTFSDELSIAKIEFESINELIDGSGIEVILKNGIEVIFSKNKESKTQISSLQQLLVHLTIDRESLGQDDVVISSSESKIGRIPKKIDFRQFKPIVQF